MSTSRMPLSRWVDSTFSYTFRDGTGEAFDQAIARVPRVGDRLCRQPAEGAEDEGVCTLEVTRVTWSEEMDFVCVEASEVDE